MNELPRPPAILDILEEHRDELGSLWAQRENVVFAPDWTLKELAHLEDRAEAHLDGLRLGAGHSVDVARPLLGAEETGPATAATFVLMAFERPELEREVVQALETAPPAARDGIRIGLRHSDARRIANELAGIAAASEPAVRAAAVDILAFHRLPAPKGLLALLSNRDPGVLRLVYEAVGRFGGPWGMDFLREALESDAPANRVAALRASARIGLIGLDAQCREAATGTRKPIPEALAFLGVVGTARDLPILQRAMARPELARAALAGMGILGSTAAIPVLLDAMENDLLAPAAGKAFARITGATDIGSAAAVPPPAGSQQADMETPEGPPPPDPTKAREWWETEKGRFASEGRWQSGFEVSKAPLGEHFNELPLETRLDLYLGVCFRETPRPADRELEAKAVAQFAGA